MTIIGSVAVAFSVGALAAGCGGSSTSVAQTDSAPHASFPKTGCRTNPLGGVHSPDRLKLLDACRAIIGTVKEARPNPEDGDAVFNLAPERAYASMLNAQNVKEGGIHVEIVPADQPGCRKGERIVHGTIPDLGKCTGAHVRLPRNGAHVRVVGAYVLDIDNAWREIHPVWRITVVGSAR
ncbi:MAG: hypothetical protein QOG06_444 [Gaiellaceae bacterium]|jgi:hypothetical protein|nr:hypothetical protein [Gaiellaceae bacterium]